MKKTIIGIWLIIYMVITGGWWGFGETACAMDYTEATQWTNSLPEEGWPEAPDINSQTAILVEVSTGTLIYAKDATKAMYPASTTKLMTALLTLEYTQMDEVVNYSWNAVNTIGTNASHIGMRTNEQLTVKDSLYGLLLPSANEVANALAEHIAGSVEGFADMMNEKSQELGTVNTHFTNANGLHDENHYTCAYDLYLIMQACIEKEDFIEIDATPAYFRPADELLGKDIPMGTTNMLIRSNSEYYNDAVVCGKTGYTDEAGRVLVTYASKDDMNFICVVMGGVDQDHFTDTNMLLNYAYQNFKKIQISEGDQEFSEDSLLYQTPLEVPRDAYQLVKFQASSMSILPKDATIDDLDRSFISIDGKNYLEYRLNGYLIGQVQMTEGNDIDTSSIFQKTESYHSVLSEIDGSMQNVYVIAIALGGLVCVILIRLISASIGWKNKRVRNIPRNRAGKKIKYGKKIKF